jgi:hypothetical protein
MKALICGGRDYHDYETFVDTIDKITYSLIQPITHVISGGASGVDSLAIKLAIFAGVEYSVYYADWDKYGRAAGPIRNKLMLTDGKPDIVIAFPGGSGTANMIKQAKAANVIVLELVEGSKGLIQRSI